MRRLLGRRTYIILEARCIRRVVSRCVNCNVSSILSRAAAAQTFTPPPSNARVLYYKLFGGSEKRYAKVFRLINHKTRRCMYMYIYDEFRANGINIILHKFRDIGAKFVVWKLREKIRTLIVTGTVSLSLLINNLQNVRTTIA